MMTMTVHLNQSLTFKLHLLDDETQTHCILKALF